MLVPVATLPLLQIALWACVAVLLAATAITLRSRWANRRPMRRCVLLSTAAHLVLIALAASVRFAAVPPGDGFSPPVRITLVAPLPRADQVQASPAVEPVEIAPEPIEQAVPVPVPEPTEPKPATQDSVAREIPDAPPLLDAPTVPTHTKFEPAIESPMPADTQPTSPATEAVATGAAAAALENSADAPAPITPAEATPAASPAAATEQVVATPSPAAAATPPPQPLADRVRPDRLQSVLEQGGSRETEQAVAEALEWLAYAQSGDGRWDASRWEGGREMYVLNHNRKGAGRNADTGISGLALLTFLGAGHTHLEGGYQKTVNGGLHFLIQQQAADGNLAGDATDFARTYCHSMATFALAEAYALTRDKRLEPPVRKATEYLVRTQHAPSGSWRYDTGQPGDLSQLGWVIMALRSAELGGVVVPETTWQRIEVFLSQVVRGQHGGLASYQPQSAASVSMTAEGLYCRQILGKPLAGRALDEGIQAMTSELPGSGPINYYYWYYATLSLHHAQHETSLASAGWRNWNEHLKHKLVSSQVGEGTNRGSWSPNSLWGGYGGRVYSTAMAAMCLEVYYRYGSAGEGGVPWMAGRPRAAEIRR
jgi:hypothetical protein